MRLIVRTVLWIFDSYISFKSIVGCKIIIFMIKHLKLFKKNQAKRAHFHCLKLLDPSSLSVMKYRILLKVPIYLP